MEIKRISIAAIFALGAMLSSCNKTVNILPVASGNYSHGVWILDEGAFLQGSAALDFYHKDKESVELNVFENVNGKPLGDVLQSMYHYNNKYYLVVNNSNEILVADDKTLKVIDIIPNISLPRYFLPVTAQKAYVTDNTGKGINILDLNTNSVSGQISYNPKTDSAYASWTEQMVQINSKVYVAAVERGKLLVINSSNDKVTDTISLSTGIEYLSVDYKNRIWALCDGTIARPGFISSKLYCLDTTGKVIQSYTFPDINKSPAHLMMNFAKDSIYYIYGSIYKMGIMEANLPAKSIVDGGGHNFYGLGIDPINGDIYAGDALTYTQPGLVFQYNSKGNLIKTIHSGVSPNGFLFVP